MSDPDLGALSPLDGRYRAQAAPYSRALSEEALFRRRFEVEIEWLIALAAEPGVGELPPFSEATISTLRSLAASFGPEEAKSIREIERRINHDVKAVEYYLKQRLEPIGLGSSAEFVHFACTSEDINNLAHALMVRDGLESAWIPSAGSFVGELWVLAEATAGLAMPAHTHGQPASPTTLGKEMAVFALRFSKRLHAVRDLRLSGKWNGAVGTYGAHLAAYPDVDWLGVSRRFVEAFGLEWNPLTTQIEPHDGLAEVFHAIIRFDSVLIDFCRDMWEYISRGYLRQRTVAGEVGSSTMPHKVNPIDFENAEANAGVSGALLDHLATKLPVSRMQRDLSDSSAIRNIGLGLAHSGVAIESARRGLSRVEPAPEPMAAELAGQWEVLAEAVQTVMRRYGLPEPYERLKELTRGESVSAEDVRGFVKGLGLPEEAEARLLDLTPAGYVGLAESLVAEGRRLAGGDGR